MTNDHFPFIAAVIARPDDDLPRLLYADYLQGEAEPLEWERGEFIRVQCELARTPEPEIKTLGGVAENSIGYHPDGYCAKCRELNRECYYHQLRRREQELYANSSDWLLPHLPDIIAGNVLSDEWPGGFGRFDGEAVGLLHRGFVSEITCSWADWQRHADAIRAATPLRKVRLTTWPDDNEWWPDSSQAEIAATGRLRAFPGIEFELPARSAAPPNIIQATIHQLGFNFRSIDRRIRSLPALSQVMRSEHTQQVTIPVSSLEHVAVRITVSRRELMIARGARGVVDLLQDALSRLLFRVATLMDERLRQSGRDPADTGLIYLANEFPRFTVLEHPIHYQADILADCTFKFASIEEIEELRSSFRPLTHVVLSGS